MNRHRDNRGRFTSCRSTPTTNSPTPSRGNVRTTPSTNPSIGRTTRGGQFRRIMTTQTKGKAKVGEGSSKFEKVPSTSQQVVILLAKPQEEELLSGHPEIVFPENPIEELEFYASSEEFVHLREDNMSGIFGDREEVRGLVGGEEKREEN
jgi:hypothetical protein